MALSFHPSTWTLPTGRGLAMRYFAAVLLAATAQLARLPIPPTSMPFITYVPFVVIAAAFGGIGPGVLATSLCVLECAYWAVEPIGSFMVRERHLGIGLTVLALTGVMASILFERLKQIQRATSAAHKELAAIHAAAPMAIVVVDDRLLVRKANDFADQLANTIPADKRRLGPGGALGCLNSLADPRGCGFSSGCDGCTVRSAVLDTVRNGTGHDNVEKWLPSAAGGKAQQCLLVSTTLLQFGGRNQALLCVQDITHRKQTELELERQAQLINLSHDAIIVADANRVVQQWNKGAEELYGWTEAQAAGKVIHELLQTSSELSTSEIDRILLNSGRWDGELIHRARDGRQVVTESRHILKRDGNGVPTGILEINRDITQRKQTEQALRESSAAVRLKLDSILSPSGDIGCLELSDVIDVEAVQSLMNEFFTLAHVPMAIVDMKGNVLVRVGWQDICTRFHRVHHETCQHCIESDTLLSDGAALGESKLYKCKNHLWDSATPLVVGGKHVGNIFTGQFFFENERVDRDLFQLQAQKYGFDQVEYLAALDSVPRISKSTLDAAMAFLAKLGHMLSLLSYGNVQLARTLSERDRLLLELQEESAKLTASHRRTVSILEAISDGFIILDRKWRYTYVNAAGAKMFSGVADELLGRNYWQVWAHATDSPFATAFRRAVDENSPVEFEAFCPEPLNTWFAVRCYPSPDGLSVFYTDITQRKQSEIQNQQLNAMLERRVEERTLQLQESNRELEAFSYSVSHDLRAPLRSVDGFAKILLRDYPGKLLDDRAADYLHRMSAASQRMGQLIADLLALSRISRQELTQQPADLSGIAAAVLAELENREPQRSVSIDLQPGLMAHADPRLMRVALENLLGNAWKFTSKTSPARISFGAIDGRENPAYFVRDNGAGFDMAYSQQLFAPFQRLHRADEFEGTGIGLATVQRIVRRHGGRIWAEATPGAGAVFYFTLGAS